MTTICCVLGHFNPDGQETGSLPDDFEDPVSEGYVLEVAKGDPSKQQRNCDVVCPCQFGVV